MRSRFLRLLFRVCGVHPYLMSFYGFSTGLFHGEVSAFYAGRKKFLERMKKSEGNEADLRRNIHRIEKALIMKPLRDTFCSAYILDTVKAFNRVVAHGRSPDENLKWYRDVLNEYFSVVIDDANVKRARSLFSQAFQSEGAKCIPKVRSESGTCPISFDDFWKLCRLRRSVRWYRDKPVPHALLDKAFNVAAQSPSACNRQPFSYRVFDQPDLVQQVANLSMGTAGFSQQFPVIIVVVGDQSAYQFERDRHVIYIDGSLASMTFMLALETLGLSSCPINWPDIPEQEKQISQELKLEPYERAIMLIAVGYADPEGKIPFSGKKPLDEIRAYN